MLNLKKNIYNKIEKQITKFNVEKNIKTTNKRYYVYHNILQKVYKSLKMNRPMIVALSVGFEEVPYINNNVGIIIIEYNYNDTIEIIEKKIKR